MRLAERGAAPWRGAGRRWIAAALAASLAACLVDAPERPPALELDPAELAGLPPSGASLLLARAEIERGEPLWALKILDRALEDHPFDAALLEEKANALCAAGFRRAAESWCGRAIAADPQRTSALLARARVRFELDLRHLAWEDVERASRTGRPDPLAWDELAGALSRLGLEEEAARVLGLAPAVAVADGGAGPSP